MKEKISPNANAYSKFICKASIAEASSPYWFGSLFGLLSSLGLGHIYTCWGHVKWYSIHIVAPGCFLTIFCILHWPFLSFLGLLTLLCFWHFLGCLLKNICQHLSCELKPIGSNIDYFLYHHKFSINLKKRKPSLNMPRIP